MMPTPQSHRFHSILCVVDPSARSKTALRYASALAASAGGTVAESDATAVARASRRLHADVVVVSAAAHPDAASTAAAVLRRFKGPVLVVPRRCHPARGVWPGPTIVAAVGDDRHRHAGIAAAARMAEHFGAWLSVASNAGDSAKHHRASLIIYPIAGAAARRLRKGSAAERFIGKAGSPVLIITTPRMRTVRAGGPVRPPACCAA